MAGRGAGQVSVARALLALVLLGGVAVAAVPTKRPPDPERGRTLYRENCWSCHGWTGEGNGPMAALLPTVSPPLAGRYEKERYDALVELILEGKGDMPAYAQVMDRHDARRILIWLATLDPEKPHDPADDKPQKAAETEDEPEDVEAGGGGPG